MSMQLKVPRLQELLLGLLCQMPQGTSTSQIWASCAAFSSCAGLHGDCCPTASGMYLGCCPEHLIPHATAPPATSEYGRQVLTLYHQTSPDACHSIIRTGFRPGHDGWCGGGIYFALSPQATKTKSHHPTLWHWLHAGSEG